jgi:hypothetical protein
MVISPKREHSRKPDDLYDLARAVPFRKGWKQWGNEVVEHASETPHYVRKVRTGSKEPRLPEGIVPTAERVTIHGTADDVIEHWDVDGL